MDAHELEKLVDGWIALQKVERGSISHDSLSWAFDKVCNLIATPDEAFQFILAVLECETSDVVMANLSAGPLEDLLVAHGEPLIARMEIEASQNPMFASLLGGVWKNAMGDEIWRRVLQIRDRRGWDGEPGEVGSGRAK